MYLLLCTYSYVLTLCTYSYVLYLLKAYFPLEPRFPNGGLLTMHMETLSVGDSLQFKGPLGEYVFTCAEPTYAPTLPPKPSRRANLRRASPRRTICLSHLHRMCPRD